MDDVITKLKQENIINAKEAEAMHSSFENTQLHFLYNFRDNMKAAPSARRTLMKSKNFQLLYIITHHRLTSMLDP